MIPFPDQITKKCSAGSQLDHSGKKYERTFKTDLDPMTRVAINRDFRPHS